MSRASRRHRGRRRPARPSLPADPASTRFEAAMAAARAGNADAQLAVACMYESGTGCDPSLTEARRWAERAARQGHADAQWIAGDLYDTSDEQETSLAWFARAAEQNHVPAQITLSHHYEEEEADGHPRDYALAQYWNQRAAAQGNFLAQVTERMRRELDWHPLAPGELGNAIEEADGGNPAAQWLLGMAIETGQTRDRRFGHDHDPRVWYERAAARNEPRALAALGRLDRDLAITSREDDDDDDDDAPLLDRADPIVQRALAAFRRAAERGHAHAMTMTGLLYLDTAETGEEEAQARPWLERAAKLDQPSAQLYLADIVSEHPLGEALAFYWYERAALQGEIEAHLRLREIHETEGPRHNLVRALHHAVQAANANEPEGHLRAGLLRVGRAEDPAAPDLRDWAEARRHLENYLEIEEEDDEMHRSGAVHWMLAMLHEQGGWKLEQDLDEALHWAREAQRRGHKEADAYVREHGKNAERAPEPTTDPTVH